MMTSGFQSPDNSPLSRSGVHLDYAPEDTLKSFVMEKRLNPNSSSSQPIIKNCLNGKVNVTSALVGGSDSVKIKRPFLRKNQGRAAWCSRLRSPSNNIIANVDSSRKSGLNSNENEKKSSGNFNPACNEIKCKNESGFTPFVNIYSCDSAQDTHKPMKCLSNSSCLNRNEKYINSNNALNTTGDEKELEEFEMLERLTENQLNTLDAAPPTCDFAEKSSIDCAFTNCKQMNNNGEFMNNSSGGGFSFGHVSRITFSSMRTTKPHLSAIDSTSVESEDREPWEEEGNLVSSKSSEDATHCKQKSLPSVRFNIPEEPSESHNEKENCFEKEPLDKSSTSVKVWIARLEAEVNRFNAETGTLIRLRTEKEQALSALEKEKKEFEKFKETTMKEFESYRQDEISKLKRERKVLSDYQKSLHTMPQKRDREEIERLKQQLSDEKAEAAQRETRLQHQLSRQRLRIEELTTEKNELLERIKRLEESRLAMQNAIAEERANRSLNGSNKLHRNIYKYAADGTVQTTKLDGTEEIVYNDGRREINYPQKMMPTSTFSNSQHQQLSLLTAHRREPSSKKSSDLPEIVEESRYPDGISVQIFSNGDKIISLPNGQREIHCSEFKRRIYPDGTVKTVFSDGRQETRYASGRVRVKDPDGNLLVDTRIAPVSQNAAANLAPLLSLTSCSQTPR
ncbi:unnamed protein product [Rodentolepis nana]|uniref:Centromere protein J C-terminal domain-containing protein n=1 Tax=Rodentolepis nana TaxID=102285 RepID=A0A158QIG2_RODNA|nr:unnamed protein product [Rodentolepis nana]